jgi:spore coat protein CotF
MKHRTHFDRLFNYLTATHEEASFAMNQNPNPNTVLNEQDMMEDLLTQEKYLISSYSPPSARSHLSALRQVLTDNFNECATSQYSVFDR